MAETATSDVATNVQRNRHKSETAANVSLLTWQSHSGHAQCQTPGFRAAREAGARIARVIDL